MAVPVLADGEVLVVSGAAGQIISATATTNASGVVSFASPYGGSTIRALVRKCDTPARSLVVSADPYFRTALVQQLADPSRVALIADHPYWGRRIGSWTKNSGPWSGTLTMGSMYSVKLTRDSVSQVGEWCDLSPKWNTVRDGTVSGAWEPSFPYASLVWSEGEQAYVDSGADLGLFKTSTGGWLRRFAPSDGSYHDIIVPTAQGAWGQRATGLWGGSPAPEALLSGLRAYYRGMEKVLTPDASVTFGIPVVRMNFSGPAGGEVHAYWEGSIERYVANLNASGVATVSGCFPGNYVFACYHTTSQAYGTYRQAAALNTDGASATINFGSAWLSHPLGKYAGKIYQAGASGLGGAEVWMYKIDVGVFQGWSHLATADANGVLPSFAATVGPGPLVVNDATWGGVIQDTALGNCWFDPVLSGRLGALQLASSTVPEGITPWSNRGTARNLLPPVEAALVVRSGAATSYVLSKTTCNGIVSPPLPRYFVDIGTYPETYSDLKYNVIASDGEVLQSGITLLDDDSPPWAKAAPDRQTCAAGRVIIDEVGGKVWGNVTAYSEDKLSGTLAEAERMGAEWGSLKDLYVRARARLSTATSTWIAQGMTSLQCPFCQGPLECETGTLGYCQQCGRDGRTYFQTPALAPSATWGMRFVAQKREDYRDTLLRYGYRPEDYQENADYIVLSGGYQRWTAQHIDFGTYSGGAWTDGENVSQVAASQARTIGPCRLKAIVKSAYTGSGCTFRVSLTRADNAAETQMLTVPAGAAAGDWLAVNRHGPCNLPETRGGYTRDTGYYLDVTNVAPVGVAGNAHFQLVNVAPHINTVNGVGVSTAHATPYLADTDAGTVQRNPDMAQRYVGQGEQHLVWRDDRKQVQYQRTNRAGYLWSAPPVKVSDTNADFPAVLKSAEGTLYCATVKPAASASHVVVHQSRDDGRTWTSHAKSFVGQYPDLWRGVEGLQYLTVYSGGKHVIRRGWRGLSTVAGSATLTAGDAGRLAMVKKAHGALLLGVPSGNVVHIYNSRDDGRTFSHQARDFAGTQIDLALGFNNAECAVILSGTRAKFVQGARNFSTLLAWPSALAAGGTSVQTTGIIATSVDSERPPGLRCCDRGGHFLAAVTKNGVVEVHASRRAGMTWSRIA